MIGDEAAPPTGHLLQRRVAHRHKLMRDDGARPRASARRVHPARDAYLGGERSGGKRGRGAPGKTVETNAEGHPLRVKLTVVEGFRLTIAAWAQRTCALRVLQSPCVDHRRRESRGSRVLWFSAYCLAMRAADCRGLTRSAIS